MAGFSRIPAVPRPGAHAEFAAGDPGHDPSTGWEPALAELARRTASVAATLAGTARSHQAADHRHAARITAPSPDRRPPAGPVRACPRCRRGYSAVCQRRRQNGDSPVSDRSAMVDIERTQHKEHMMQKFDTPAPISAVLDIPAGRVQFVAADRADTAVEVRPASASKSRDVKAAEQTTVEYADGVLRIETSVKNQYLGSTGSIDVTVQLPAGSQIEAKAASAELRTVGRLGDVVFEGAYRQIKIDEAASLRLTAVDGDVEVGRLE
ncbi:hypothetical protein AB0J09_59555, partial [Nonomuraea sp. NPDC049784]